MNIVHFSTSDSEGGSARSARRIHEGLRKLGHDSHMLVGTRATTDAEVDTVHGGGLGRIADRVAEETTRRMGLQYLWYPSGRRVLDHPWVRGAEAIQVYNTHGGYLSHRILPALARRAPLVWRLSDMWAVTGHCAYAGPCERWRTGCGACPDLATHPSLPLDTTRFLWRMKQRIYARARPTIVAPSRWLEGIARASPLFAGLSIRRIPNGVDRTVFRAVPSAAAREVLGLPPDRPIVLFSAQVLDDNTRKGSADAIAACRALAGRAEFDLALVGIGGESWRSRVPQRVHTLGYIREDRLLAAAYAAADVTVAPSTVENLSNSILESLACGTPVVATDSGGIREAVRHGETGWVVAAHRPEALAEGIAALLGDDALRRRLGEAGMALIDAEFSAAREVSEFAALYAALAAARRTAAAA